MLPVQVLVLIVIVTSLTSILSIVGLRTIIPLMVPSYLWERANAIDANGYVVATILGPPIAASLVAILGAPEAMIAIAIPFGLAAAALIGLREPATTTVTSGHLHARRRRWHPVRLEQPDDPRPRVLDDRPQPVLGRDDDHRAAHRPRGAARG